MVLLRRAARCGLPLDRLLQLAFVIGEPFVDQRVVAKLCLRIELERRIGIGVEPALDAAKQVICYMMRRSRR